MAERLRAECRVGIYICPVPGCTDSRYTTVGGSRPKSVLVIAGVSRPSRHRSLDHVDDGLARRHTGSYVTGLLAVYGARAGLALACERLGGGGYGLRARVEVG